MPLKRLRDSGFEHGRCVWIRQSLLLSESFSLFRVVWGIHLTQAATRCCGRAKASTKKRIPRLLLWRGVGLRSASDSRSCRPKAATAMNSRVGRLGGHSHDSRNLTFLFRSREATTHRVYLNEVDTPLELFMRWWSSAVMSLNAPVSRSCAAWQSSSFSQICDRRIAGDSAPVAAAICDMRGTPWPCRKGRRYQWARCPAVTGWVDNSNMRAQAEAGDSPLSELPAPA